MKFKIRTPEIKLDFVTTWNTDCYGEKLVISVENKNYIYDNWMWIQSQKDITIRSSKKGSIINKEDLSKSDLLCSSAGDVALSLCS